MLVDLARNDVARVAEPGTRRVAELLRVDRYSRVMHLVSRVTARLARDLDAYRACMNMGTLAGGRPSRVLRRGRRIPGQQRRLRHLHRDRSAYVTGGKAIVQAGARVARDSNPQSEANETLHKAYAVPNAIALSAGAELEVRK